MLWFGVTALVLMLSFGYWQLNQQRDFVFGVTNERASSISHEMSVSVTSWALAGDLVGLQEVLLGFRAEQDMQHAFFIDTHGRVLASTHPEEIGLVVSDPLSLNLLASKVHKERMLANQENLIAVAHPVVAGERLVGWLRVEMSRDSANANIAALTRVWLNFTVISVLLVIAISVVLSRRLTRGLNHLMATAAQVAQGDRQARAQIRTHDEIGVLAAHLNEMLDTLEQQRRDLVATTVALRESREGFQRLLNTMAEGVYEVDTQGVCLFVNQAFLRMLGYQEASEVVGQRIHELIHHHRADGSDYPSSECRMYRAYVKGEELNVSDEVFWRKDGSALPVEYWSHPIVSKGEIVGAIATFVDITERKRAEDALRESESKMREIVESAPFGAHLYELMADDRLVFVGANHAADSILGVSNQQFIGKTIEEAFPPLQDTDIPDAYRSVAATGKRYEVEQIAYSEGKIHSVFEVHAFQTGKNRMAAFFSDITELKGYEEQIHNLAFFDALTQLPNRRLLNDRLSQVMAANRRSGRFAALMFLDLDNFKPLNDQYGHAAGDLLLIEVADRLKGCVREMDTVARFGGDEFVVMLSELDGGRGESDQQARVIAEKICSRLSVPYIVTVRPEGEAEATVSYHCSASIGVVVFASDGSSQDEILRRADDAMYEAKDSGRSLIRFYRDGN